MSLPYPLTLHHLLLLRNKLSAGTWGSQVGMGIQMQTVQSMALQLPAVAQSKANKLSHLLWLEGPVGKCSNRAEDAESCSSLTVSTGDHKAMDMVRDLNRRRWMHANEGFWMRIR